MAWVVRLDEKVDIGVTSSRHDDELSNTTIRRMSWRKGEEAPAYLCRQGCLLTRTASKGLMGGLEWNTLVLLFSPGVG